jgi:CelD/BcsL family acetyltransferase involved in cellulose biosynthesis
MNQDSLRVLEWDEPTYLAAHDQHGELLARASAHPLFHSWDWLSLWWKHFGKPTQSHRLRVYVAYEGERLIGMMPLIDGRVSRYRWLRLSSAGVLGSFSNQHPGVPTEYHDVIAEAGREAEVLRACLQRFWMDSKADELTIGWCHRIDRWRDAFNGTNPPRAWKYFRLVDPLTSYSADLSRGFEHYLRQLSGNARRSIFNQRRKLLTNESVVFRVARQPEQESMLTRLNTLHITRWGVPAFAGRRLQFHMDLIARLGNTGAVVLSELRIDDRCVSVLYDVRAGLCQYNIHMGFDPKAIRSGSLGLLHLGYAMEAAASEGMRQYDFLAGQGMKSDYKRHFATDSVQFSTVQMVRSPWAALLFRINDKVRSKFR